MSDSTASAEIDPRLLAFCSPQGPEIFQSVAFGPDIWKSDPFDVEEIHAEAREAFRRLLDRAARLRADAAPGGPSAKAAQSTSTGKILLLLGESGAGKTHLMRAFRQTTHGADLGYFCYLQLTTNVSNYFQYILRNVMDSLSQPYDCVGTVSSPSGLHRLSNALAENAAIDPKDLQALRDGEASSCARLAETVAEQLIDQPGFARAHVDEKILRAVLMLQCCEPKVTRKVTSYLRCEPLSVSESEFLDLPARAGEDDPREMLGHLGSLAHLAGGGAFVICLDQLESLWEKSDVVGERFRRAMQAVQMLTDANPASIVVIACLDDYFVQLRALLDRPMIDRIEQDPEPVKLMNKHSLPAVERLVGKRLSYLYDEAGLSVPEDSVYPFCKEDMQKLARLRTRAVLYACYKARERSVRLGAGELPRIDGAEPSETEDPNKNGKGREIVDPLPTIVDLEQRWNDFHLSSAGMPPEEDAALAALLAWAVGEIADEAGMGGQFAARSEHTLVQIETPPTVKSGVPAPTRWLAALCNKPATGGSLSRQIAALTSTARQANRSPMAVRAAAFPGKAGSKIADQLGELVVKECGRRAVIEDAEWRVMTALREFLRREAAHPHLDAWRRMEKPLNGLAGLRGLLQLEEIPPPVPVTGGTLPDEPPTKDKKDKPSINDPEPEPVLPPPISPPPPPVSSLVPLGKTREIASRPVEIDPGELTRHAAFLGSSGSGKTTLALAMIEELLLRGVPAILLDRKGDLASYADPASWAAALPDGHSADAAARRARLREKLDVQIYTPGAPGGSGRALGISLLPQGVGALASQERDAAARSAAAALGAMMNYRAAAGPRLAILGKAIETLAALEPDTEMTLFRLVGFIADQDASLMGAIGHLVDPKLFKRLVTDLETFRLNQGHLLAAQGERVDAARLFGVGAHAPSGGKTRLSIISTKFFDDTAAALFWITQFLQEISRFASKRPSGALQGVVLFDEADLYLPAVGKPVTKEPMENALRRWRSAGIGVLLASQSPGDFDYKCRDNIRNWFIGKVTQETALAKMKPMLRDAKTDVGSKLAGLSTGQFFLVRDGKVDSLAANRSLISAEQLSHDEILRAANPRNAP